MKLFAYVAALILLFAPAAAGADNWYTKNLPKAERLCASDMQKPEHARDPKWCKWRDWLLKGKEREEQRAKLPPWKRYGYKSEEAYKKFKAEADYWRRLKAQRSNPIEELEDRIDELESRLEKLEHD